MKSLGKDELGLISRKLTFSPDYTRFRSVCNSWRSAAPKRPHLPWLIAHVPTDSNKRSRRNRRNKRTSFFKFYELSFETNKFLRIPELSEVSLLPLSSSSVMDNKMDCIGYSQGWVALFNRSTSSVSLFNPLTNSSIDLPILKIVSADDVVDWERYLGHIYFYLTSDPGESLSDCFALVNISSSRRFFYCKVGYTSWIEMLNPEFYEYSHRSHVCCYGGKIFIASAGNVFVGDFGLFECKLSVRKIVSFTGTDMIEESYLVESDGDLLLVIYGFFDEEDEDESSSFRVFKLEFGREMAKLVELKGLGDKALFFSSGTTFSLTASKYPYCKANSIYSTYNMYDRKSGYKRCIQKLAIYDFEKRSSVIVNDDARLYVNWKHCGWFTPSLLK